MNKLIARVAGVAVALAATLVVSAQTANANYAPAPGWMSPAYVAPTGTICFQTGGSTFLGPAITAAAAAWNQSDLTVVAKASCTGYPRRNQVRFVAYYDSATSNGYVKACAVYSAGKWSWVQVRGVWTWVGETPTVRMNYTPLAMKQCHATTKQRTTTVSHETGHYFGLDHRTGITVMTVRMSSYSIATYGDKLLINRRY